MVPSPISPASSEGRSCPQRPLGVRLQELHLQSGGGSCQPLTRDGTRLRGLGSGSGAGGPAAAHGQCKEGRESFSNRAHHPKSGFVLISWGLMFLKSRKNKFNLCQHRARPCAKCLTV